MNLTKPQIAMLTKAMRGGANPVRQQWATAGVLEARGLLNSGEYNRMYITDSGLVALLEYRARRWAKWSCMAYLQDLQEVEDAIAEATGQ